MHGWEKLTGELPLPQAEQRYRDAKQNPRWRVVRLVRLGQRYDREVAKVIALQKDTRMRKTQGRM